MQRNIAIRLAWHVLCSTIAKRESLASHHCSARGRWQLTCELCHHILRAYPYNSNGAFAFVAEICLDTGGEVNDVAVDAGFLTIRLPGSSTSAFSPIPCVPYILAVGVFIIE